MPAKRDILDFARDLGRVVARARTTLPELAQAAAEHAAKGRIDVDDANAIYATYYRETGASYEQSPASTKANASKLRQIIKAASNGGDTAALLRRVVDIHSKMHKRARVKPLYEAMVLCCRRQIEQKRALTNAQIEKLLRR